MANCPICGGTAFGTYRNRANARCAGCGAKERARMMALTIQRLAPEKTDKKVFHFAPEVGIANLLIQKYREGYQPADYSPELYAWSKVPVVKVDLSRPLQYFNPSSVHGFVHSHVLEHIPGSIERVISEMNVAIAPGGFHLFQIPIEPGWYREDMDPDMPPFERERIFRQADHLRMFGATDFDDRFISLFKGFKRVDIQASISVDDLIKAAVPPSSVFRNNGHTAFLFVKE